MIGKCHFAPVPYDETKPDRTLPYDDFKEYYMSLGIDHLELQDDKQVSVWYYDDYSKELDLSLIHIFYKGIWKNDGEKSGVTML